MVFSDSMVERASRFRWLVLLSLGLLAAPNATSAAEPKRVFTGVVDKLGGRGLGAAYRLRIHQLGLNIGHLFGRSGIVVGANILNPFDDSENVDEVQPFVGINFNF